MSLPKYSPLFIHCYTYFSKITGQTNRNRAHRGLVGKHVWHELEIRLSWVNIPPLTLLYLIVGPGGILNKIGSPKSPNMAGASKKRCIFQNISHLLDWRSKFYGRHCASESPCFVDTLSLSGPYLGRASCFKSPTLPDTISDIIVHHCKIINFFNWNHGIVLLRLKIISDLISKIKCVRSKLSRNWDGRGENKITRRVCR